jgi:hypothetical protein
VAVFPLHDYFVHDEDDEDSFFIYGGEGGQLAEAHRHHIKVLHNQEWSRRNLALRVVAQLLQLNCCRMVHAPILTLDYLAAYFGFRVYQTFFFALPTSVQALLLRLPPPFDSEHYNQK